MPIWAGSTLCLSFKRELFEAIHDFKLDIFKLALYTYEAEISSATIGYKTDGELPPLNGYTTGGTEVSVHPPQLIGTTAIVDFDDAIWTNASFTARGAILYNFSKSGYPSLFVLDFGEDRIPNAGTFAVRFPGADPSSAILRIP
jgi:hypothetical protein